MWSPLILPAAKIGDFYQQNDKSPSYSKMIDPDPYWCQVSWLRAKMLILRANLLHRDIDIVILSPSLWGRQSSAWWYTAACCLSVSLEEKLTVGCSIKTYLGIVLSFTLLTSDLARARAVNRKLFIYMVNTWQSPVHSGPSGGLGG